MLGSATQMGADAYTSAKSAVLVWKYLAHVLVQDSLELLDEYPDHRVHMHLKSIPAFMELREKFLADKLAKVRLQSDSMFMDI